MLESHLRRALRIAVQGGVFIVSPVVVVRFPYIDRAREGEVQ